MCPSIAMGEEVKASQRVGIDREVEVGVGGLIRLFLQLLRLLRRNDDG